MKRTVTSKKILNALYGVQTITNITEITRIIINEVIHILIAESNSATVIYSYQVYNAKNTSKSLELTFELYNKLLELFTIKSFKVFKVENYLIINGVKWENIENINISTIGEAMLVIDDALSHGFSFLVHNYKLYYKED